MANYDYDIAISFAEEDVKIAEQIAEALKAKKIKPYFYKDERAENWGENLFNIILKRYSAQAHFALILISKDYVQKWWTNIERQIIQMHPQRDGHPYLLPLYLDDTQLEGLTKNTLREKWKDNAEEIAGLILKKIQDIKKKEEQDKLADANRKDTSDTTRNTNINARKSLYIEKSEGDITF